MSGERNKIKDYSPQKLVNIIEEMGEPSYRAGQVLSWLYTKKVSRFEEMTNLPAGLRERLEERFAIDSLTVKEKFVSPRDGTVKYLFAARDGHLLECAVLRQDYGNTVCVSSQIGCGLGCVFCASTEGGLARNLTAGEMLDQFILGEKGFDDAEKIKNIVVMGMGEPLNNLNELLKFLRTANNPKGLGIGYRNITVSTAGIVPKILELAKENLPITLAVSLHAPDNETRSRLMPVNKKYPVETVMDSCQKYFEVTGRRVSFEYTLMAGQNDSPSQAQGLVKLIKEKDMAAHINLIPVNPAGREGIKSPSREIVKRFYEIIESGGVSVSIRRERGKDIEGACGQLRRRYMSEVKKDDG